MKVYYRSLKWTVNNRGSAMRNCHYDSDWDNIWIDLDIWLSILDKCMYETIEEKKIRYNDSDQFDIVKLQMLTVVCELFCIKQQSLYDGLYNEFPFKVHWKNHYAPGNTLEWEQFIYWLWNYNYCYSFINAFLPATDLNTIITYDEENKNRWNFHQKYCLKWASIDGLLPLSNLCEQCGV